MRVLDSMAQTSGTQPSPVVVRALALTLLLASALALPATASPMGEGSLLEGSLQVSGGGTVLQEQVTATWCEICARSDPRVSAFEQSVSPRVQRVALHPDDGSDPLGTRISSHRIVRVGENPATLPVPTIWHDGQGQFTGEVSEGRLQLLLLAAESERRADTELDLRVERTHVSIIIDVLLDVVAGQNLNDTQLSLFVTEDDVDLGSEEAAQMNGIIRHQGVARALIEVPLTEVADSQREAAAASVAFAEPVEAWSATLERHGDVIHLRLQLVPDTSWTLGSLGFTVVHESVIGFDDLRVLGAVSAMQRDEVPEGAGGGWVLVAILFLSCMLMAPEISSRLARWTGFDIEGPAEDA
jgi:hypothetical protein